MRHPNTGGKLKAQDFDTRKYEDDFFRWCGLRSGYLSEASVDEARPYLGSGPSWYGPAWYGPGWYWVPNFLVYTFVPADGIYYSPFGWGFYSPIIVYRSPFFFYGYYGHGPHRFEDFHYPFGDGFEPRGGFHGGGFHGLVAPEEALAKTITAGNRQNPTAIGCLREARTLSFPRCLDRCTSELGCGVRSSFVFRAGFGQINLDRSASESRGHSRGFNLERKFKSANNRVDQRTWRRFPAC